MSLREDKVALRAGGRIVAADAPPPDWSVLAPEFETMVDTPEIRGAVATLLGADALIPTLGAGTPLTANPFDQQFHKDGTGMVIREHFHRSISAWYYAQDTTVVMGPTSVVRPQLLRRLAGP